MARGARRILVWFGLLPILLIAAVAGVGYVARHALLETVLVKVLATQGYSGASLKAEALSLSRVVLSDLEIAPQITADRITVDYRLDGLLDRRVETVTVEGLAVRLDLEGDGPPLPLPSNDGEATGVVALPFDLLEAPNVRIEATTPFGPAAASIDLDIQSWTSEGADLIVLRAGLSDMSFGGIDFGQGGIAADFDPAGGALQANLGLSMSGGAARLDADITGLMKEPRVALAGDAELDLGAETLTRLTGASVSGQAVLDFRAAGSLDLDGLSQSPGDLAAFLDSGGWTAAFGVDLAGFDLSGMLSASRASARVEAAPSAGGLKLNLSEAAILEIDAIDLAAWTFGELPEPFARLAADFESARLTIAPESGATLTLDGEDPSHAASGDVTLGVQAGATRLTASARAEASAAGFAPQTIGIRDLDAALTGLAWDGIQVEKVAVTGSLTGTPADLTADLAIGLRVAGRLAEGVTVGSVSASLPVTAALRDRRARLTLDSPFDVTVRDAFVGDAVTLPTALTLRFDRAEAIRDADGALRLDLAGRLPETDFGLGGAGDERRAVTAALDGIELSAEQAPGGTLQAKLILSGGSVTSPRDQVAVEAIAGEAALGADGRLSGRVTLGEVRDLATPARLAPLSVEADLGQEDDTLRVEGVVSPVGTFVILPFQARYDLPSGRIVVDARLPSQTFAPDGLQPAALSPLLKTLEKVSGSAEAAANLTLKDGQLTSGARLSLDGLSFRTAGIRVEGITGTLNLESLLPPETPPGQRLNIARIDAGLPLEDISLVFRVVALPDREPALQIDRFAGGLAGGEITIADVTYQPDKTGQLIPVRVTDLDLERFLDSLNIQGLSGEGLVSGALPISTTDGGVAIEDGNLAARGTGIIRYRSEAADAALAGQASQVDLVLQALKDFRYELLSIGINAGSDGEAALAIRMEGRNPDVFEGHPLRFNINVSGNVGPLIAALKLGRELSTDLLERTLRRDN